MKIKFNRIEEAIEDISNGKMVIVVDDEDRENEGDLVMAAQFVTPEAINFMIKHGKGLVCLPVTDALLEKWDLQDMVTENTESMKTAFTVSIDGAKSTGVSTGISASDRAKTIQIFINPETHDKSDIVRPGHIFPLRARAMGVLRRAGHTEAAVDLARLSGFSPAGVICEIIKEDGEMARVPQLAEFARQHNLKMITIKALIEYRIQKESFIKKIESVKLPTAFGDFDLHLFEDTLNNKEHVALTYGNIEKEKDILVRVHSECLTGDAFLSQRCDCGGQLHSAMSMIQRSGAGVLLYMRQEGRGIGLKNKIKAYKLQENGYDTVQANHELGFKADLREYGIGAQILLDLGVSSMKLITNNPKKIVGLEGYGLAVSDRIPIQTDPNQNNVNYLKTKYEKLGHMINFDKDEKGAEI